MQIKTWAQADAGLRELGLCQAQIEQLGGRLDQGITRLKERAAKLSAPLQKRAVTLEQELAAFWADHAPEVAPHRSVKLTFGSFGVRSSRAVALLKKWTEQKVIEALAAADGLRRFLRIAKPTLNRLAVLGAPAEELASLEKCGIRVEERESFFAEPDRARLAPELPQPGKGETRAAAD